ncbi:MAG TPA: hypothetical protein VN648_25315, partial [Candidatus Methylomirabilis sp.]|nr:hypothetical protein [Candidatus Methylomirabilis sp.]
MFRLQIPELEERSQSSRRGARARRSAQIGWELEGLEQRALLTAIPSVTAAHVFTQNPNATHLVPVSNLQFSQPTVAHPQDAGTKPHPLGPLSLHTPQGSNGSTINLNNLANPKLLTLLTGAHALTLGGALPVFLPTFQPPQATPGILDFGELAVGQQKTLTFSIVVPDDTTVIATAPLNLQSSGGVGVTQLQTLKWSGEYGYNPVTHVLTPGLVPDQTTPGTPIQAKAGETLVVTVQIGAAQTTGPMSLSVIVYGDSWSVTVPVTANVTLLGADAPVLVNPDNVTVNTAQSEGRDIGLTLVNFEGRPNTVVLSAQQLPDGLSMAPLTVSLQPGQTEHVTLHVTASDSAAVGQGLPLTVGVQTIYPDATANSSVTFTANVFSRYGTEFDATYSLVTDASGSTGNVHCHATVIFKPDGSWTWHAHLEDRNVFLGDNFDIYFGSEPVTATSLYQDHTDSIGCVLTGGNSLDF